MPAPSTVAEVVELLDEYVCIAADEFQEIRNTLELLTLKLRELEETIRELEQGNRGCKGGA